MLGFQQNFITIHMADSDHMKRHARLFRRWKIGPGTVTTVIACSTIAISLLFPFIPLGTSTGTPLARYRPSFFTIPPASRLARYANRETILICLIADRNAAHFRFPFDGPVRAKGTRVVRDPRAMECL